MTKQTRDNRDCGTPLSEHMLENYSGGGLEELLNVRMPCHVPGCGFLARNLIELNEHRREAHPERYK